MKQYNSFYMQIIKYNMFVFISPGLVGPQKYVCT